MLRRLVILVVLLIVPGQVAGQSGGPDVAGHRTPWGDPDLQGIWDYRTSTPLERPDDLYVGMSGRGWSTDRLNQLKGQGGKGVVW